MAAPAGVDADIPLHALADALEAGMSARAVVDDAVIGAALGPRVRASLRRALDSSVPMGAALRGADVVDDGAAAVIDAGERGGFLPRALRLVASSIVEARKRRRRALAALAYPAFLVALASVIVPLPRAFAADGGIGAYLAIAGPGVAVVVAALVAVFIVLPRAPVALQQQLAALAGRVPFVGAVVVEPARAAVYDVLGALTAAGVSAVVALPAAIRAGALWNAHVDLATRALGDGGTLASALAAAGVVDASDPAAARLALAERTGTVDKALPQLAQEARDRAGRRFMVLAAATGFVCFAVVAVFIGISVIQGFMGYVDAIDAATRE